MKNQISETRDHWIETELMKLRRELDELKYQQPITIKQTNVATAGPAVVANGKYVSATGTVTSLSNKTVMAVTQSTLYKSPGGVGDNFPTGSNWSDAERENVWFSTWHDYATQDGKNMKLIQQFLNKSGSSITVLIAAASRVIADTSSS